MLFFSNVMYYYKMSPVIDMYAAFGLS